MEVHAGKIMEEPVLQAVAKSTVALPQLPTRKKEKIIFLISAQKCMIFTCHLKVWPRVNDLRIWAGKKEAGAFIEANCYRSFHFGFSLRTLSDG